MFSKHHGITNHSDASTTRIILIVFFVSIVFLIAAYFIANWRINQHERNMHYDLEACQTLLTDETSTVYNSFPSSSHEAVLQEPEIRRMLRRKRVGEQIRDHISGVYEISVRRVVDDASLSSDSSNSESEDEGGGRVQEEREEEEEDSSESESENSDDSDSDSDEVVQMRGLLSMRKPLPKKVIMLRAEVREVRD